jgi:hypothetical protein
MKTRALVTAAACGVGLAIPSAGVTDAAGVETVVDEDGVVIVELIGRHGTIVVTSGVDGPQYSAPLENIPYWAGMDASR